MVHHESAIVIVKDYDLPVTPQQYSQSLLHMYLQKKNGVSSSVNSWEEYFSVILGSDEVKSGKPAPDLFLEAAEKMGVDASCCLVIEDSFEYGNHINSVGIKAGKAANMQVAAVPSVQSESLTNPRGLNPPPHRLKPENGASDIPCQVWGVYFVWVEGHSQERLKIVVSIRWDHSCGSFRRNIQACFINETDGPLGDETMETTLIGYIRGFRTKDRISAYYSTLGPSICEIYLPPNVTYTLPRVDNATKDDDTKCKSTDYYTTRWTEMVEDVIMTPTMTTRNAGRRTAATRGERTGGWTGRGGGRTGEPTGIVSGRTSNQGGQARDQGIGVNGGIDEVLDFSTVIAQQLQDLLPTIIARVGNHASNIQGDVRSVNMGNGRNCCSYNEFMACNPKDYTGKGGAIVYTCWIEKIESIKDMTGHAAYTDRFHELARLVPHLVTLENKRIKRYIYCLALHIRAMVAATEPTTIQSVVLKVGMLTDEAIRNGSLKKNIEKIGNSGELSRKENDRDENKRSRIGRVFTTITD
ncbi:reverse transcriptase domain-containing protein [Tanacetum coccineum]